MNGDVSWRGIEVKISWMKAELLEVWRDVEIDDEDWRNFEFGEVLIASWFQTEGLSVA